MRPPTLHDNAAVRDYLHGFWSASEACREFPWMDHILSGVLALRTTGDTATRSLSRKVIFTIIQRCEVISTDEVSTLFGGRYGRQTVEKYAAAARVASKAIAAVLPTVPRERAPGVREDRLAVDAPFAEDAARAEAECLRRGPTAPGAATFDPLRDARATDRRQGLSLGERAPRRAKLENLIAEPAGVFLT